MHMYVFLYSFLFEVYAHIYVCNNRIIYNLIFCVKENLKVVEDRKNYKFLNTKGINIIGDIEKKSARDGKYMSKYKRQFSLFSLKKTIRSKANRF